MDDRRGRLVPQPRADIGGERHRRQPVPVERDIREPCAPTACRSALGLLGPAALPLEHRERSAPRRPRRRSDRRAGGCRHRARPSGLLAPDREHLDGVVIAGGDRLRGADRQRLGGEVVGVLEIAREQSAHRRPDRRVPGEQRLAQALGAGHERIHLRVDRVAVARLEQVDREPGMGLQLELEVPGLARAASASRSRPPAAPAAARATTASVGWPRTRAPAPRGRRAPAPAPAPRR